SVGIGPTPVTWTLVGDTDEVVRLGGEVRVPVHTSVAVRGHGSFVQDQGFYVTYRTDRLTPCLSFWPNCLALILGESATIPGAPQQWMVFANSLTGYEFPTPLGPISTGTVTGNASGVGPAVLIGFANPDGRVLLMETGSAVADPRTTVQI